MTAAILPSGPTPCKVLVLGDFPTVEDEKRCQPFTGGAGDELRRMLQEAGFLTTELRFMYLCNIRPYASQAKYMWTTKKAEAKKFIKDWIEVEKGVFASPAWLKAVEPVEKEIVDCTPNVIITLGDMPLWYMTGKISITKWRGSQLQSERLGIASPSCKVIPTYSPTQILRVWQLRSFAVRDMKRAFSHQNSKTYNRTPPNYRLSPTFGDAMYCLRELTSKCNHALTRGEKYRVTCDIETIARNIACIGFGWSKRDAICIPLMIHEGHHFTLEQEVEIIWATKNLLQHPAIKVVGQNFSYDTQHILRSWGYRPKLGVDTMLAQHTIFPGIPKDLAFLGSMYQEDYVYWKDDLNDYRSLPADLINFWNYNCKDCAYTYEISEVLETLVPRLHFEEQEAFLLRVNQHVLTMMTRGIRIDEDEKSKLALFLMGELEERKQALREIVGFDLNIASPKQMQQLFYKEMGFKPVLNRATHRPTCDGDALKELANREVILQPLVHLINETRSIGVFLSTFVMMPLDEDKRMRCNFNVGGTETYRFSSSKNAFGSGGNLQNIPKGDEDEVHKEGDFVFPNLRRMFIPDRGYTLFDVDLSGADAQIVAWEADDADLKAKFRSGEKIHALNAKDMYGAQAGADGKKQPYYAKAKMGCHLSNYGGTPYGMSKALGMTIREAEAFQRRWFSMHPGIKEWHERIENDLMTKRCVANKFGFRRFYFDRIENLLPEALAWIPQSTVALIINKALCNIAECDLHTIIQLLIQVHDSLVGQYPTHRQSDVIPVLRKCLEIPVPYDDPLTIGTSLDLSIKSWGDLESHNWE